MAAWLDHLWEYDTLVRTFLSSHLMAVDSQPSSLFPCAWVFLSPPQEHQLLTYLPFTFPNTD